jgi:ribose transport system substrate-binding protein
VCEGALFIEHWPKYVLAMAVAVNSGITAPPLTIAPQVMVTKDTVDQYFSGTTAKTLPPLAAENTYLKQTGVLQKYKDIPIPGL